MNAEIEKTTAPDVGLQISRFMISSSPEMIFWTDDEGQLLDFNEATCGILGYTRDELMRMSVRDFDPEITAESHAALIARLTASPSVTVQTQPRRKDGSHFRMEFVLQRVEIDGQFYICTRGREIVLERQLRNRVLEALATGLPLREILNLIVALAEKTRTEMIGSVLLIDESGRLRIGSDSRLPDEYCRQIDGLEPGPGVGSCGTAVFNRSSVLVSDISTSPLWTSFRGLAKIAGVQACWSEPIFSPDKQVVGTLAMYFRNPQVPTPQDHELLKTLAQLAGIAVDRAQEHDQLLKSEIRNRSLVQSTSTTVWTTSPEGAFVAPQEIWSSYTGQTWDEHKGFGWKDAIHPEDQDRLLEIWTRSIDSHLTFNSYGRIWHAASEMYRHFEVHAIPIIDGDRIVEWVGCTTDVHDRKIAEIKLQRIKTILAEAQEVANLGSWEWTFDNDRVFWTDEFCLLHGMDLDHREGDFEALISTVYFEDRERILKTIQNSIETGNPIPMEYRILGKDETLRTVFSKMKFEKDFSGKNCGLLGTVLDVTDLRKAEDALRQSERQLRTITDSLPVRIAYIDTNYCFQFTNAMYETVFDRPRSDINGRHMSCLLGQNAFNDVKMHFDAAFQGTPTTYEQRTELPDQTVQISEVRLVPDVNSDGKVVGVYKLVDDITDRRALEQEVIDIAGNEHRRIGQDLHDGIGQELTGLGMIADTLLLSVSRKSAPEEPLASKLALGIKRALGQIKSLARGLNPVDISSEGLMSALSQMADHVTDLYGIDCRFSCESIVSIDDNQVATQLFRIAQEATTNAAKHAEAKKITISLAVEQGIILLLIVDDGIGIIPKVKTSHGMGIRTMHYRSGVIGGTLKIANRDQGGTEVQVKLPRGKSHLEKNSINQGIGASD